MAEVVPDVALCQLRIGGILTGPAGIPILTALKTRVNHDDNFICISYEFAFFRSLCCFLIFVKSHLGHPNGLVFTKKPTQAWRRIAENGSSRIDWSRIRRPDLWRTAMNLQVSWTKIRVYCFPYGNPDAEFDVTSFFFFWVEHASCNPFWTSSIDGTFSSKANRWRTKTILIRHYLIHWLFLVWFSCLWEW